MNTQKIYTELLSEALNPGKFAAAAAEEFGKADRKLREAFAGSDPDEILAAIRHMLVIGDAYTTALDQQSLNRDLVAVLVMMILNTDMAGVDPAEVADELMRCHTRLFIKLGNLREFYEDDSFALPHIRCIIYMESLLMEHLSDSVSAHLSDAHLKLQVAALTEAARDVVADGAPEWCIAIEEPFNAKSLYIDIFSRFNALGFF